jgi:cytochrome P450
MRALQVGSEKEVVSHLKLIDDFVYDLIDKLIAQKKASLGGNWTEGDDLLSRMIPLAEKADGTYDRVLVRDMLLNLVIAGRDTTAANMSWLCYELCLHPEEQATIHEEVVTACGGGAITFDNVAGCHYLQAAITEAQRLHPSVPMDPKVALKADRLPSCGLRVKPGDLVFIHNYVQGVNPKIWGSDAAEFKPKRWLDASGVFVREDQFKFPAFNGGKRLCLGIDMAYLEMRVVIGQLVQQLSFELVPGQLIRPARAIVLQMENGLKVKMTRRKDAPELSYSKRY